MFRSVRVLAALTAAMLLPFATPALAVGTTMVMSTSQKIELVRDLPNEPAFEHDGQYYDLGYLYSTERVNGADVARSGSGFVLYHDDRFARLDAAQLSEITYVLGEDPTAGYVPPASSRASASTDGADAASSIPSSAAAYAPPARRSGSGVGIIATMFVIFVVAGLRFLMRSAIGAAFGPFGRRKRQPTSIDFADPFESRVNARLAEIDNERFRSGAATIPTVGEARIPSGYEPDAAAPVARGFGRKQV